MTESRLHVIVPTYNRPDLLHRCLSSIAMQDDPAFDVIVADDASTDPQVAEVLRFWSGGQRWFPLAPTGTAYCHTRTENVGATRNLVDTIRAYPMAPNDPIVIVDGDDCLARPEALRMLRARFDGTSNLVVYGSYRAEPPDDSCPPAVPIPEWVLRAGAIRELCRYSQYPWNHLISLRRCVFDAMDDADFQYEDGTWMKHGYDVAVMSAAVELGGIRVECNPDVLYVYRSDRPDSAARAHREEITAENAYVSARPRRYEAMPWEPS
jgi:cellulose synthase/poly-beta-1,6-N-acetylglucosamine synthase-like glycosyltransferase